MTSAPDPEEVAVLNEIVSAYCPMSQHMAKKHEQALAILDRLSPAPEPDVDEATVWTRKVIIAWAFKGRLEKDDLYFDAAQLEAARQVLAELLASKDAEIAEWKLAADEARSHWDSAVHEWNNAESELATLRAENERLKADAAATEAKSLRLAWETARGTNADMHKTPLSAYQTIVWALKKLYDGASLKAAERNTAEPEQEKHETAFSISKRKYEEKVATETQPGTNAGAVEVTQADWNSARDLNGSLFWAPPASTREKVIANYLARHRTEAEARGYTEGRREALEGVVAKIGSMKTGRSQPIVMTCAEIIDDLKRMMTGEK